MTTGKYKTRAELEAAVIFFYETTKQNIAQVARTTHVSTGTVTTILANKP